MVGQGGWAPCRAKRSVRNPIKCVDKIKHPPPSAGPTSNCSFGDTVDYWRPRGEDKIVSSDFDDYLMWTGDARLAHKDAQV